MSSWSYLTFFERNCTHLLTCTLPIGIAYTVIYFATPTYFARCLLSYLFCYTYLLCPLFTQLFILLHLLTLPVVYSAIYFAHIYLLCMLFTQLFILLHLLTLPVVYSAIYFAHTYLLCLLFTQLFILHTYMYFARCLLSYLFCTPTYFARCLLGYLFCYVIFFWCVKIIYSHLYLNFMFFIIMQWKKDYP